MTNDTVTEGSRPSLGHDWKEQDAAYRDTAYQFHKMFLCSGCGCSRLEPFPAGQIPTRSIMGMYPPWDGVSSCTEVVARTARLAEEAKAAGAAWSAQRDAYLAKYARGFYWVYYPNARVRGLVGDLLVVAYFDADTQHPRWWYPDGQFGPFAGATVVEGPLPVPQVASQIASA